MKRLNLNYLKPAALTLAIAWSGQYLLAENMDPIKWCSQAGSESARITCLEEALKNRTGQTPNVADPAPPSEVHSGVSEPHRAVTTTVERKKDHKESLLDKLGKKVFGKSSEGGSENSERLEAHVSSFKFVGYRKLWVKLDNGQIWQQKKSDRSTLEAKLKRFDELDVELWQTGFGGYRMHIPEINKTLAVTRLN